MGYFTESVGIIDLLIRITDEEITGRAVIPLSILSPLVSPGFNKAFGIGQSVNDIVIGVEDKDFMC